MTTLESLLEELASSRAEVADEINALQAIFGDSRVGLYTNSQSSSPYASSDTIRLSIETTLVSNEEVPISFVVSVPPTYPEIKSPQIQLLNKYVGDFATDSALFGKITRIFLTEGAWTRGEVAIFEGLERAREACDAFHADKLADLQALKAVDTHTTQDDLQLAQQLQHEENVVRLDAAQSSRQESVSLPSGCVIHTSQPILDRKSVFIGHACKIKDVSEVGQVVAYLLEDRKIAKAAHPVMRAYRCRGPNGTMHQDNNDDGETAAGSRLAHLLQILDIENVLVIVTRWFGGVHLGSDRFKHINQAARDALLAGAFIKPSTSQKR